MRYISTLQKDQIPAIQQWLASKWVSFNCPLCKVGTLHLDEKILSIQDETGIVTDYLILACTNCYHIIHLLYLPIMADINKAQY